MGANPKLFANSKEYIAISSFMMCGRPDIA